MGVLAFLVRARPEDVAEEFGAVAEEFFVQGPVRAVGSDVDVDDVVGEESGEGVSWGL